MKKQESVAAGMLVAGIVIGIICLVADMNGGPSWLHAFTWVGGFAGGYALVTLIVANRSRRR